MRYVTLKKALASLTIILLILPAFVACTKDPGEGGSSKITGKVLIRQYNLNFTYLISEYYAPDMDVYIIYGDGVTESDRVRTGPDGDFEFPYLRKGKYRIYVYSDDSTLTAPSGTVAVFKEVDITKNRQTVDAGTIVSLKN